MTLELCCCPATLILPGGWGRLRQMLAVLANNSAQNSPNLAQTRRRACQEGCQGVETSQECPPSSGLSSIATEAELLPTGEPEAGARVSNQTGRTGQTSYPYSGSGSCPMLASAQEEEEEESASVC